MKKILICGKDVSKFTVVYDPRDGEAVKFAAEELARYVELASGVRLSVITKSEVTPLVVDKMKVGPGASSGSFEINGEEDFFIECSPDLVRIVGGQPRGTLYGVYDFLEHEIGWRFLTPDCEVLTGGDVDVAPVRRRWRPVFEWRDVCSAVYWDEDISAKRKLNSSYARRIGAKRGGSFFYPGRFVHTMESLLGVPQGTQPCFSDPDNLEKCIASVRELLRANPEARIISVTQNDNDADKKNYCTCPRCAAVDAEEGSHAGTLIRFVNAVADAVRDEFPRVKIITLAYLHTLECPKITRPRDNVIIEFAPMTMNFVRPVTDPCNAGFISEFEKWGGITDKLYIWDYIVNFSFSVPVFPDFGVIRPNLRYYADHNVTGMFLEGDNHQKFGETSDLAELRDYLLAKLLAEPFMTEDQYLAHRRDFLLGYYGKNGEAVGSFVDIITEIAAKDGHFVGCFQNPQTLFPIEDFVARIPEMDALWDLAEQGAVSDAEKAHCERSRIGYSYLKILYAFDKLSADPATRDAIAGENESLVPLLRKYNVRVRGIMSDFARDVLPGQNAAAKIYWD